MEYQTYYYSIVIINPLYIFILHYIKVNILIINTDSGSEEFRFET